jgi:hypothetical protein
VRAPGAVCALLLAGGALRGAPAEASSAPLWEVRAAAGPRDERLPALIEVLEKAAPAALRGVEDRLGISPGPVRIRWRLDLEPRERAAGKDGRAAGTGLPDLESGRTAFVQGEVVVTLPGRKYLRSPGWAEPAVLHEAAHAAMASSAGSPAAYERIPGWFREGIALWFSGEGPSRVREAIAFSAFQGARADAFLQGIDVSAGDPLPARMAAEAFLAVACIEKELGTDALRALARDAIGGRPVARLLEGALEASPRAFRSKALSFSMSRVRELIPEGVEELFARSLALRARGDPAAPRIWEDLLSRDHRGPLDGTLLYLLGRAALDTGSPAEARAWLEKALDHPEALWRPECLVLLGECHLAEGNRAEAERTWRDVAEGWAEDAVPSSRARAGLAGLGAH